MRLAASIEQIARDPAGRWIAWGSGIFWCASPTLCGAVVWGRPNADETRTFLRIMDGYRSMAPRFDLVQDAGAIEGLDPDALALVIDWLRRHPTMFADHVRSRCVVLPPGIPGLALAGLEPMLGLGSPVEVFDSQRAALVRLLPDGGDALADELDAIVDQTRGVPALVGELRRVLAEARGAIDVATAAQKLSVSVRSLQRQLGGAGLSFRGEQGDARFHAAEELLAGDEKIAAIAARLGLSDDGLTELCRARTGLTPGELRRRLRG